MLQIAGGILIAILFLACIPLLLKLLEPLVLAIIYVIAAPFMLFGWIKSKLFGDKHATQKRTK